MLDMAVGGAQRCDKHTVSVPYNQYGPTHTQTIKDSSLRSDHETWLPTSFLFSPPPSLADHHLECNCRHGPTLIVEEAITRTFQSASCSLPRRRLHVFILHVAVGMGLLWYLESVLSNIEAIEHTFHSASCSRHRRRMDQCKHAYYLECSCRQDLLCRSESALSMNNELECAP